MGTQGTVHRKGHRENAREDMDHKRFPLVEFANTANLGVLNRQQLERLVESINVILGQAEEAAAHAASGTAESEGTVAAGGAGGVAEEPGRPGPGRPGGGGSGSSGPACEATLRTRIDLCGGEICTCTWYDCEDGSGYWRCTV